MAELVYSFDWPDRFVTGTVGEPGSRTFYLQAQDGARLVSVALEKQQSQALADGVDSVLDQLMAQDGNPHSIPAQAPAGLEDDEPLATPVQEVFRVGQMRLAWDSAIAQVIIEADELLADDDQDRAPEVFIVRLPVGAARAFAARTRQIVGQGRPLCPLCEEPLDADHVCADADDFDEFDDR